MARIVRQSEGNESECAQIGERQADVITHSNRKSGATVGIMMLTDGKRTAGYNILRGKAAQQAAPDLQEQQSASPMKYFSLTDPGLFSMLYSVPLVWTIRGSQHNG